MTERQSPMLMPLNHQCKNPHLSKVIVIRITFCLIARFAIFDVISKRKIKIFGNQPALLNTVTNTTMIFSCVTVFNVAGWLPNISIFLLEIDHKNEFFPGFAFDYGAIDIGIF